MPSAGRSGRDEALREEYGENRRAQPPFGPMRLYN